MSKLVIGKTIAIPCMRAGLAAYENPPETILITQDILAKYAHTAHGIPVVIEHVDVDTGNVEDVAVGRVADLHYREEDSVWLAHFVVDEQEAVDKLRAGWGVSTCIKIKTAAGGGTLNNVPYDREVGEFEYQHLAIVKNPRYEMARGAVFYNSKDGCNIVADAATMKNSQSKAMEKTRMLQGIKKFWRLVKEEIKLNEGDELWAEVDGKEVNLTASMAEMDKMTEVKNAEETLAKEKEKMNRKKLNGDDEIEYAGQKMTVNEFVKRHGELKSSMEKKNEETPETKKNEVEEKVEEKVDDTKKNEVDDAKEKGETQDRHDTLNNAATVQESEKIVHLTLRERTELGRARYGSAK